MKQIVALMLVVLSPAALAKDACLDFDKYAVSAIYDGPRVVPHIARSNPAYRYRTTIRREADGPPNFAGHLRVVTWGCGTDCHEMALVDSRSGDVWLVKGGYASSGYQYNVDSSLLVSDLPEMIPGWEKGDETAFEFLSESYLWDESALTLRKLPQCKGRAQQAARADTLSARP